MNHINSTVPSVNAACRHDVTDLVKKKKFKQLLTSAYLAASPDKGNNTELIRTITVK